MFITMDTALENGDFALGGNGRPRGLTGEQALLHRAWVRLAAKRGCFAYDPGLGSFLYRLPADAGKEEVRRCAQEALQPLPLVVEDAAVLAAAPFTVRLLLSGTGENGEEKHWEMEVKPERDL